MQCPRKNILQKGFLKENVIRILVEKILVKTDNECGSFKTKFLSTMKIDWGCIPLPEIQS